MGVAEELLTSVGVQGGFGYLNEQENVRGAGMAAGFGGWAADRSQIGLGSGVRVQGEGRVGHFFVHDDATQGFHPILRGEDPEFTGSLVLLGGEAVEPDPCGSQVGGAGTRAAEPMAEIKQPERVCAFGSRSSR